jgi:hypothetical protein
VLNGANQIAIETKAGWMVAAYQSVRMVSSDVFMLSGCLTGLFGTEDFSALGADAGARVVVLDDALVRADLADHEIGVPLQWRVKSAGPLAEAFQFEAVVSGRARKPLRPGHLRAGVQADGDIDLTWTRRARHSADRWDTPDVPLLEEALLYRIEVSDGAEVIRNTDLNDTAWTYTLATQAADGVVLPGPELVFRVVQVSPGFGDGLAAEVSL